MYKFCKQGVCFKSICFPVLKFTAIASSVAGQYLVETVYNLVANNTFQTKDLFIRCQYILYLGAFLTIITSSISTCSRVLLYHVRLCWVGRDLT